MKKKETKTVKKKVVKKKAVKPKKVIPKKPKKERKLSGKQLLFCKEFMVDRIATLAYIRAGYSEKGAAVAACKLLRNAKVKAEVDRLTAEQSERLELTSDMVLIELSKMGFANMQNLYDKKGNLIPVHKLPKEVAACLQEVTEETIDSKTNPTVVKTKYKMACKKGTLELLGKHLKLFTDVKQVTFPDGVPVRDFNDFYAKKDKDIKPEKKK